MSIQHVYTTVYSVTSIEISDFFSLFIVNLSMILHLNQQFQFAIFSTIFQLDL